MDDVRQFVAEFTAQARKRKMKLTPEVKRLIEAAASDAALVSRARFELNAGTGQVDWDTFCKLRMAEQASYAAVFGERTVGPDKIEVQFIPGPKGWEDLKAELAVLRAKLAAYESGKPHSEPTVPAAAPSVPPPVASTGSPAASPSPACAAAPDTLAEKRPKALAAAPIVNGSASERYPGVLGNADNPRGVSAFERFDYPTNGRW